MKSPFPGMDPFLEDSAWWSDFHSTFINYWREAIADALPQDYEASLGDRVYRVDVDPDARKLGYPDVAIPLTILEGPRESYIEILHQPDRSLVTVLELLSLANKEQPCRTEYLAKRRGRLVQSVHLVELDLLIEGHRPPLEKPLPAADYYYFLSRAEQRPNCQVYRWTIRQPLPTLPVPLRAPDGDLAIDLAAVFQTAYERGKFRRRVNYRGASPRFLSPDDRVWAQAVLNAAG